jgi:hypothetical protein
MLALASVSATAIVLFRRLGLHASKGWATAGLEKAYRAGGRAEEIVAVTLQAGA